MIDNRKQADVALGMVYIGYWEKILHQKSCQALSGGCVMIPAGI